MFKLNNKGFAFSTILYGLMIMGIMIILLVMSAMQTNRSMNKYLVEQIEDELNRFSLTQTEFDPRPELNDGQQFIVPRGQQGWYKIELYGAAGGVFGDYVSSVIYLNENAHLYFYVGDQSSGFNKKATDVRTVSGSPTDTASKNSILMLAGGAGSASSIKNPDSKYDMIHRTVIEGNGHAKIEKISDNPSSQKPNKWSGTGEVPNGTYYIQPLALGGLGYKTDLRLTSSLSSNTVKLSYFNGDVNQKWTVTKIEGTKYYKISSVADNRTLQILDGSDIDKTPVGLGEYVGGEVWEKFEIVQVTNYNNANERDFYWLNTPFASPNNITRLGFEGVGNGQTLKQFIRNSSTNTQRFKFIPAEY